MRRRGSSGVRLYGIVKTDGLAHWRPPAGVRLLTFRELAAVVEDVPPGWRASGGPDLDAHRAAIEAVFVHHSIVPVSPGVVFRKSETLAAWLDLHYAALHDAVTYVDGRAEARVHVRGRTGESHRDGRGIAIVTNPAGELNANALELFREIGREAAAWVLTPPEAATSGLAGARDVVDISASFLVDRVRWREFAETVAAEAQDDPVRDVVLTGPWPPYDFVRLQFGG
jgi:hypothetical protein